MKDKAEQQEFNCPRFDGDYSKKKEPAMSLEVWEEFKSNLHKDMEVWQVISAARRNWIPFGDLDCGHPVVMPYWQHRFEEAVKKLLSIIPASDLVVWNPHHSNWFSVGKSGAMVENRIYRPKTHWQPPQKPKELVGHDYIHSLNPGLIIRHDDGHIGVTYQNCHLESRTCVMWACKLLGHCDYTTFQESVSEKNTKTYDVEQQAERIEELESKIKQVISLINDGSQTEYYRLGTADEILRKLISTESEE